jgi:hypothetical protein
LKFSVPLKYAFGNFHISYLTILKKINIHILIEILEHTVLASHELTSGPSFIFRYILKVSLVGLSPNEVEFFNLPNPSSHTMALGFTQPLIEMSTRNLPGGKGQLAHKADKLIAMCEPIV